MADQGAHRRLGQHLLNVVRRQDAAIPADRRAPRTAAEMRLRQSKASGQQACGTCQGAGGRTVDSSSSGITRQGWVRCDNCQGTGRA
ncbi:hypothetical protein [Streptomyces rishiriensis]|uniref:hypothetical protein n=1 Tax=Streptomyces rishiriensis TaxID=68264 RepID=UPI0027D8CB9D|nr:hypothetical protein [Streptomyces rishiriensis]